MGPDDIPNSGISLNGRIYFLCNTGSDTSLANPQAGDYSVLVQFDEAAQTFTGATTISPASRRGPVRKRAPCPWSRGTYFSWAAPQLIFNDVRDNAYGLGGFIHYPNVIPDPPGDGLNGPAIGNLAGRSRPVHDGRGVPLRRL
jgi:hypothetical protein